jgi:hypothetical protein
MEKWKFFTLSGLELPLPLVVQPIASRYTDWAIPAPIWICIHTKWQCCLNLQFKANTKEWRLLNGLRIMRCISFNDVWFSDKTHFHLDGEGNKQNERYWTSENRRVIHDKVHHAPGITVWVAISSHALLGPIFFEEAVNSEHYVSMLRNTSAPHLLATGLPLQTQWFMHDRARQHIANVVLDFLHDTFVSCAISNRFSDRFACGQNWSPNSPDLIIQSCNETTVSDQQHHSSSWRSYQT